MDKTELEKKVNELSQIVETNKNEYIASLGAFNYLKSLLSEMDKQEEEDKDGNG